MRDLQHSTPAPSTAEGVIRQSFAYVDGHPALAVQQRPCEDGSGLEVLTFRVVPVDGEWSIVTGWLPPERVVRADGPSPGT